MDSDSQATDPTIATQPDASGGALAPTLQPLSAAVQWFLILLVFLVQGGAPPPDVNETHYLTKAKHYWDADFCPGDAFLDSADPHLVFYWSIGWLTRWASLPVTAWIGRLVCWAALAAGWLRLSRAVGMSRGGSVIAAALLVTLLDRGSFAGEWIVGGVEGKGFAYALVFTALADLARGKFSRCWIGLGVASSFHVLVGGWSVLAALGVWVWEPRAQRPALRAMVPALLLGGVLSLPGLIPALLLDRAATDATRQEAARIYVFERLPHHLALLSLDAPQVRWRLGRLAFVWSVALGLVVILRRVDPVTAPREQGGESLQGLRRVGRFAAVAAMIALVGFAIEGFAGGYPNFAAGLLRFYWYRLADVAVPIAISLATAYLVGQAFQASASAPAWRWLVLVPLMGCGWHLLSTSGQRALRPVPPADRRLADPAAWRDACAWVRRSTPAEARFFIPRGAQSFRWYAHRADVGNWKDVPQNAVAVTQWFARCADLCRVVTEDGQTSRQSEPARLGSLRIRQLAAKYPFDYVLTRNRPMLQLPTVYSNTHYAIYAVPSR
jgi:hypothetical protein